MGEKNGCTIAVRMKSIGWFYIEEAKTFFIGDDGYIRVEKLSGNRVILNPDEVLIIGREEDVLK